MKIKRFNEDNEFVTESDSLGEIFTVVTLEGDFLNMEKHAYVSTFDLEYALDVMYDLMKQNFSWEEDQDLDKEFNDMKESGEYRYCDGQGTEVAIISSLLSH